MLVEVSLPLVFLLGIAIGIAGTLVFGPEERIVEQPCEHGELNARGDGHQHDWHVQGKEKGLVKYACSNPICDETRQKKQVT